jgi:small subunit ribosomal protein S1
VRSSVFPYVYLVRPMQAERQAGRSAGAHPKDVEGPVQALESLLRQVDGEYLTIREPEFVRPVAACKDDCRHLSLEEMHQSFQRYHDGARVPIDVGYTLVKNMLRQEGFWCRLEVDGEFFVHVGQVGEIYIGARCPLHLAGPSSPPEGVEILAVAKSPYDLTESSEFEQRPADALFWARVVWSVAMGEAAFLEEERIGHVFRWHRLAIEDVEVIRSRIGPRARLRVWPAMETDTDKVSDRLVGRERAHVVWESREGQILDAECEASSFETLIREVRKSRGAMVRVLDANQSEPLFTAVMPDGDGILRARWRTQPSNSDRRWSAMRELRVDTICTGTVTHFSTDGTTYVDIGGGITAGVRLPELSWRSSDVPSELLTVGERIAVKIIQVDLVHEEVWLSRKVLHEDPLRDLARRVGSVVTGEVTKVVPIGYFVRVEPTPGGWEGLLPRGELSQDVVPGLGDVLSVKIVDVDLINRRILVWPAG